MVLERLVCLVLKVLLEKKEKRETADLSVIFNLLAICFRCDNSNRLIKVYRVIVDHLDFLALPDFQVFLEHLERKAYPLW